MGDRVFLLSSSMLNSVELPDGIFCEQAGYCELGDGHEDWGVDIIRFRFLS